VEIGPLYHRGLPAFRGSFAFSVPEWESKWPVCCGQTPAICIWVCIGGCEGDREGRNRLVRVEIFRCRFIRIWGGPLRCPACQSRKKCLWGMVSDLARGGETEGWNGILTSHNLPGGVKKLNPDAAMGFHLMFPHDVTACPTNCVT